MVSAARHPTLSRSWQPSSPNAAPLTTSHPHRTSVNLFAKNLGVGREKIAQPVQNFPKGENWILIQFKSFSDKRTATGFRSSLKTNPSQRRPPAGGTVTVTPFPVTPVRVAAARYASLLLLQSCLYLQTTPECPVCYLGLRLRVGPSDLLGLGVGSGMNDHSVTPGILSHQ